MPQITCPVCSHHFSRKSLRFDELHCPKCKELISFSLSDQQIGDKRSSLQLQTYQPCEVVQSSFLYLLARAAWGTVFLATGFAIMLTLILMCFGVVVILGGNFQVFWNLPKVAMTFFEFTWLFFAIISIPVALIASFRQRLRRIYVDRNDIVIELVSGVIKIPIEKCSWRISSFQVCDDTGCHFPFKPRIVIGNESLTPNGCGGRQYRFACGFTPQALSMWQDYFSSIDMQKSPNHQIGKLLTRLAVISTSCGAIAFSLGLFLEPIVGDLYTAECITFLGWFDGIIIASIWHYSKMRNPAKEIQTGSYLLLIVVGFSCLGLKTLRGINFNVAIIGMVINGIIGGMAVKYIQNIINHGKSHITPND